MHNPAKESVIKLIKHSQVFHFAGHGYAHPTDPSQSYLLLPNKERLSGEDLMTDEMTAARPWLAYLSACSTSRTHEERLMNESSHLNGAFLLAGFRHIVGTLWEVSDSQSQKLASLFYSKLKCNMKNGKRDEVALALNIATRELRNTLMGRLDDAGMGAGREEAGNKDEVERTRHKSAPGSQGNGQYLEDAVKYVEDWRDLCARRKNRQDDESTPDRAYFTWAAYVHMGL
ncbi:CHAT domain-containing protein [Diaporthe sp. PMI_573]|nr:CHAT domain-containing protein [Diaporthaceae sp. PMI_573]